MNPFDPAGRYRAMQRGRRILQALHAKQVIAEHEYDLARAELRTLHVPQRRRRPAHAMHAILKMEALLSAPRWVEHFMHQPRIRTTLDLDLQDALMGLAQDKGLLKSFR